MACFLFLAKHFRTSFFLTVSMRRERIQVRSLQDLYALEDPLHVTLLYFNGLQTMEEFEEFYHALASFPNLRIVKCSFSFSPKELIVPKVQLKKYRSLVLTFQKDTPSVVSLETGNWLERLELQITRDVEDLKIVGKCGYLELSLKTTTATTKLHTLHVSQCTTLSVEGFDLTPTHVETSNAVYFLELLGCYQTEKQKQLIQGNLLDNV